MKFDVRGMRGASGASFSLGYTCHRENDAMQLEHELALYYATGCWIIFSKALFSGKLVLDVLVIVSNSSFDGFKWPQKPCLRKSRRKNASNFQLWAVELLPRPNSCFMRLWSRFQVGRLGIVPMNSCFSYVFLSFFPILYHPLPSFSLSLFCSFELSRSEPSQAALCRGLSLACLKPGPQLPCEDSDGM